jgi:aspartate/methionine/tyrosine aminotransferase
MPGTVFGPQGEGFVRFMVSPHEEKLLEAFRRLEAAGIRFDHSQLEGKKRLLETA